MLRGRGAPAETRAPGGGAWAKVWRPGSRGEGAGPAGRAGGGASAGPERAGPRRGAGTGGPSVTHAAVREVAAAVAAGAAGTGTGARTREGADCLPPSLAFRLWGWDRPSAPGKEEGGPRTPTSSLSSQDPGQGGGCASDGAAARSAAERTIERPRRGTPGPFALGGAVGRDPMRRSREGLQIPSPGSARRRRRAVLQLPKPGSHRQEAAERT